MKTRCVQKLFWLFLLVAMLAACSSSGGEGTAIVSVKLPKTGQVASSGTRFDDGVLRKGVAWPVPRFSPVSSGTGMVVTDNLTGLMWAGDGGNPAFDSCTGLTKSWQEALDYAVCLNDKNYLGHTDWRLPNRKELRSLVHYGVADSAAWLNTQGFSNVQSNDYWTSSTYAPNKGYVSWCVDLSDGWVASQNNINENYVMLVRSGR